MSLQLARATDANAEERRGLKEKLECLKRANKKRRKELGEMKERLKVMHQSDYAYDKVRYAMKNKYR